MQSSTRFSSAAAAVVPFLTLAPMSVAIGQSSVAVSPFVSYVPSAATNPLAGMALTFGGTTGLALRGSADMSISNPAKSNDPAATASTGGYRPWSADADGMLFLGGLGGGATVFSRSLSPYLFSGIGMTGGDSAGKNVVQHGWSYGAGATIPLGLDADVFAEARWRMSQYVLPTAKDAPDSKSELRFGLSFHVGGGSSVDDRPRRRRRMDDDYDDVAEAPVVVVPQPAPAPAPAPQVVVVQPAPQPAPVIVVPQQEPEPQTAININLPGSVVVGGGRHRRSREVVVVREQQRPVYTTKQEGVVYRNRTTTTTQTTSCSRTTTARRRSDGKRVVVCTAR